MHLWQPDFGQHKSYFSVELGELYLQTDNSSIQFWMGKGSLIYNNNLYLQVKKF